MNEVNKLVILGSGPAGFTAAIYAGRAALKPVVVEGPTPGGQPMITTVVENFPGFPDAIRGPELVTRMRQQAEKYGAKFLPGEVKKVDFSSKPHKIFLKDGKQLLAMSVIVATGAYSRRLGIPGEEKFIGRGVSTCATCDAFFYKDKTVAVVGGGDTALTDALELVNHAEKIYIIHRRDEFRASKVMQEKVFQNKKIEVLWNKNVIDIKGKEKVEKAVLKDTASLEVSELKIDGLFLAIGHLPNTQFLENQLELDEQGYVVAGNDMSTSVEGVFAAGDVIDPSYKQLPVSVGSGCKAALEVEKYLRGQ
jgi:thioredoxin reductase (NADPH)